VCPAPGRVLRRAPCWHATPFRTPRSSTLLSRRRRQPRRTSQARPARQGIRALIGAPPHSHWGRAPGAAQALDRQVAGRTRTASNMNAVPLQAMGRRAAASEHVHMIGALAGARTRAGSQELPHAGSCDTSAGLAVGPRHWVKAAVQRAAPGGPHEGVWVMRERAVAGCVDCA